MSTRFTRARLAPGLIDVHTHICPPGFVEALEQRAGLEPTGAVRQYLGEVVTRRARASNSPTSRYMYSSLMERLHLMDEAEIAVQVLSSGSSLATLALSEKWTIEIVAAWNDAVQAEMEAYEDRFVMFASLPFPYVDAALEELTRVSRESSSVVGYTFTSHVQGRPIADQHWKPVFEAWNEMSAVVFCHPNGFRCGEFAPRYLTVDVGTQFEDTLTALQLAEGGYLDAYPDIQWVVPHLGGTLPFVIGRVDEHWERDAPNRQTAMRPGEYMHRLHFDTAGHDTLAVRMAVERFGAQRFLFGSDFPMVRPDRLAGIVADVERGLAQAGVDLDCLTNTSRQVLGLDDTCVVTP